MTSDTPEGSTAVTAEHAIDRRRFMQDVAVASVAAGIFSSGALAAPAIVEHTAEAAVKRLYESLSTPQRQQVCFAWDHVDENLGLLRTRVAANWQVTKPRVHSDFYTPAQQRLVREVFERLVQRDWIARFDKQLRDDAAGFGNQSIAIFGAPGRASFSSSSPAGTSPCAVTAGRRRRWPLAARSSTATPPAASTKRSATRATSSGTRP